MFHNILNTTLEDIAQLINCVDLNIFVLTKSVQLCTIYIMVRNNWTLFMWVSFERM